MTRPGSLCVLAAACLMAVAASARAEDPPAVNAKQVAGLFMQSCIRFAGDKDGLRDWAKKTGLKELPPEAQDQFLYGLPGVVFDASNQDGKFVLVSEDGGSCSTIAETVLGCRPESRASSARPTGWFARISSRTMSRLISRAISLEASFT